jgi:hypothetical protein
MANKATATQFQPGFSGNPGGRPRTADVVRHLSGKRAWHALRHLLEGLNDDVKIIVIDAREAQLHAESPAPAGDEDRYYEPHPARAPLTAEQQADFDAQTARAARRQDWDAAFCKDWVRADQMQNGAMVTGYRHVHTGEWLGYMPWSNRKWVWVEHQMGLDAIGARETGSPQSRL